MFELDFSEMLIIIYGKLFEYNEGLWSIVLWHSFFLPHMYRNMQTKRKFLMGKSVGTQIRHRLTNTEYQPCHSFKEIILIPKIVFRLSFCHVVGYDVKQIDDTL